MEAYEHLSRQDLLDKIAELEKKIECLGKHTDAPSPTAPSVSEDHLKKELGCKVLDALPDMLSVLDYQGNYIELVSSEKTVHIGDCSANLKGKNIKEFLPPEAYSPIRQNLENVVLSQDTGISCHSFVIEGEKQFFENRITPLDDRHVICICRNITEAVKTQEQLEMVKAAVNNSMEEIYASTLEGTLIFANKQFRNRYKIGTDLHRYKIYDIYPGIDRENWKKHIDKIQAHSGPLKYTSRQQYTDGKTITLEITTYILQNLSGEKIIWSFGRDLSETIRQEKKIQELNFIMDTILNNVPVYLFVKDTGNEFRYLYWNKAFEEHSRIRADKVLGHTDEEIFPRVEDAKKFREDDLRLLKQGKKIEFQEDYLTATGEVRTVNTIKTLVSTEDKPPLIIGISWDITELKNTEKALIEARQKAEQSDKLKSAFLANMSHEIRTPLNAIVGFSKLITETEDPEEHRQYDDIINKNAALLLQLINDILDLSKIEAGTLEFIKKPVDLKELCKGLWDIHCYKTAPGVQLLFDDTSPEYTVISDSNRLAQVLSNLITNAQKFTQQGEIRFGYRHKEKEIEFFVQDTGIGIAPENIDKIFNRFTKLNNFAQGSGLGLAISHMIVENLGGQIWTESIVGKGSTFRFTIPAGQESKISPTFDTDNSFSKEKKMTDQQKLILVAEDVDSNFLLLKALIGKYYNLVRAVNGLEVVELNKNLNPDLILMDIKMPEMDGLEATRIIRQDYKNVPIIALTAFAFESDKAEAIKAGCNDFLTKPLSFVQLKQTLEKYL